jgi:Ras GTPase-activating-like protein IQGAP2/3
MSSNTAGIFTLSLESTLLGVVSRIASEDVRMEDLLQAKYEKRPSLALFNGKVKVNFELFLYQINKKYGLLFLIRLHTYVHCRFYV